MSSATGIVSGDVDTILCLYCQASIHFVGLPATRYQDHLFKEHNILFDTEAIVERTLDIQLPDFLQSPSKRTTKGSGGSARLNGNGTLSIDVAVQVELIKPEKKLERFSPSPSKINLRPRSLSKDRSVTATPPPPAVKRIQRVIPWFAGCEYECKVCKEMYYYNQDLRKHVKKDHMDPDEYLDKYENFETKAVHMNCKECGEEIKRNFTAVSVHLYDHNMTLADYEAKFKPPKEYKVFLPSIKLEKEDIAGEDETHTTRSGHKRSLEGPVVNIKKIKVEDVVSEPDIVLPSLTVKTEPSTGANPWYRGCEYKCQLCNLMFYELQKLLFHIRTQHQMTAKPYQKQFKRFETKTTFYRCKLCDSKVKHQYNSIEKHLLSPPHNTTMKDYAEIFHPFSAETGPIVPQLTSPNSQPSAGNRIMDFATWSQGTCEFTCQLCQKKLRRYSYFLQHLRMAHKMEPSLYKEQYGDSCTKIKKMECWACYRVLRHDYSFLMKHIKKFHNMEMRAFYKQYCPTNEPEPSIKTEAGSDMGQESTPLPPNVHSPATNTSISQPNPAWEWSEGCEYGCKICQRVFTKSYSMLSHLRCSHDLSYAVYKKKYGLMRTKDAFHDCRMCNKSIVHTRKNITLHCKVHGIELSDYYYQYISPDPPPVEEDHTELPTAVQHDESSGDSPGNRTDSSSPQIIISDVDDEEDLAPGTSDEIQLESSRWASACEFSCKVCGKIYRDAGLLKRHVFTNHNLGIEDYKLQYGRLMTNEVKYKCKICNIEFQKYRSMLYKHLRHHKLTIIQYYVKYVRPTAEGKAIRDAVAATEAAQKTTADDSDDLIVVEYSDDEEEDDAIDDWLSQNTYKCKMCPKGFKTSVAFYKHLLHAHHIHSREYIQLHGPIVPTIGITACRICNTNLKHIKDLLIRHFTSHNMTVKDYFRTYIKDGGLLASTPSAPPPVKVVPPPPPLTRKPIAPASARSSSKAIEWSSGGVWRCLECDGTYLSRISFYMHVVRGHGYPTAVSYLKKHGLEAKAANLKDHECRICHGMVRHDTKKLTEHLEKVHATTLEAYYHLHIKNGGVQTPELTVSRPKISYHGPPSGTPVARYSNGKPIAQDFSRWKEACKYDCRICGEKFNISDKLRKHLQTDHGLGHEAYIQLHGPLMTKVATHQCRICGNAQRHNSKNLHFHLKTHDISVYDYYQRYIEGQPQDPPNLKTHVVKAQTSWRQQRPSPQPSPHSRTSSPHVSGKGSIGFGTKSAFEWKNQCIYQCGFCSFRVKPRVDIVKHLKTEHLLMSNYQSHFTEAQSRFHICKLCASRIKHDGSYLKKHMADKHNMSVAEYHRIHIMETPGQPMVEMQNVEVVENEEEEMVLDDEDEDYQSWVNKCTFKCKICGSEQSCQRRFREHLEIHQVTIEKYEGVHGNPFSVMNIHNCLFCNEELVHEEETLVTHMGDFHGVTAEEYFYKAVKQGEMPLRQPPPPMAKTQFPWDQNRRVCAFCQEELASKKDLEEHLADNHDMRFDQYPEDPYEGTRFHRCMVCGEKVRCEFDEVSEHLKTAHAFSIVDYENDFKDALQHEFAQFEHHDDIAATVHASNGDGVPVVGGSDPLSIGAEDIDIEEHNVEDQFDDHEVEMEHHDDEMDLDEDQIDLDEEPLEEPEDHAPEDPASESADPAPELEDHAPETEEPTQSEQPEESEEPSQSGQPDQSDQPNEADVPSQLDQSNGEVESETTTTKQPSVSVKVEVDVDQH